MRPFRRILAVVDPTSDNQPALLKAAVLAKQYRANLELFASCYYSYLADIAADHGATAKSFSETTVQDVTERLAELAESIHDPSITITYRAEWHRSRHDSILEAAKAFGADLIVKDTHYHTAISRALFTNTDWSLIRESDIPLWLVKEAHGLPENPRIMVAVDLGKGRQGEGSMDESLLQAGKELTRVLHGELFVYHAFDLLPVLGAAATWAIKPEKLPVETLRAELLASREEAFNSLTGRHGIAAEGRLLKSGSVIATLPGTAIEYDASLLVIGAVTADDSHNKRIGGTAEAVLDHVPCDLLILQPARTK